MNKLTKIMSLVLALMILTLSLAACGGGSEGDGTVTGEVTVVVEVASETYRAYVAKLEELDSTDEGVLSVIRYLSSRAGEALEVTMTATVTSAVSAVLSQARVRDSLSTPPSSPT